MYRAEDSDGVDTDTDDQDYKEEVGMQISVSYHRRVSSFSVVVYLLNITLQ